MVHCKQAGADRGGWWKTAGLYLVIGSGGLSAFFFYQAGCKGLLASPAGSAVTIVILLFYFLSGFAMLKKHRTRFARTCFVLSMLLQSVGFSVAGLYFRYSFAPVVAIEYSDTMRSPFSFTTRIFAFAFSSGYESGVDSVSVAVNLLPLLLLFLLRGNSRNSGTR